MSEQLYNGKPIGKLTDGEVLELAGNFGPAVIGQELHDRAAEIQRTNPGGAFGPAILDPNYGKDVKAALEASDPKWDHLSRADVAALADVHQVSYKARASRTSLVEMLTAAGVVPPAADAGSAE